MIRRTIPRGIEPSGHFPTGILAPRRSFELSRLRLPLATLLVLAVSACHSKNGAGRHHRKVPVITATVQQKAMPEQIEAIGNVQAHATVTVKSQVAGELQQVHFTEGDRVHAGDLLFTIDPRPFQAALDAARANYNRDQVLAKNARADVQRYENLVGKGFVSKEQYDSARANAESLEASLSAERSAIETAKLNLAYTAIRSPITGRTGSLTVDAGNVLKANDTALVVVRQIDPIYVTFSVPEKYLGEIRSRAKAGSLAVMAQPTGSGAHPVSGKLDLIENAVDTSTGSIGLRAEFANPDETLWPGQFVGVTLQLGIQANAIVVPSAAVQQSQQKGSFVFVVGNDNKVAMRDIIIDRTVQEQTIVAKGLQPGEVVVTEGQLMLRPGAEVEIKSSSRATKPTASADTASDAP